MTQLLAFAAGALVLGGIIGAAAALTPHAPKPAVRRRSRATLRARWAAFSPRTRVLVLLGLAAGIFAAVLSDVLVLVLVVPIAVIGIPMLLGKPDTRENDLLAALEAWARSLSSASATGNLTLREVIIVTRTSTPQVLRPGVDRMVQRMQTAWSDAAALRAFADEMGSAWVDEIVVYLVQAADFTPRGLAEALEGIADNLSDQVQLRASIVKERARPRRTMTQIAWITGLTVALIVVFARTPQLAAFSTPLGQVLLVLCLGAMAGLFMLARHLGRTPSEPRFLLAHNTDGSPR